MTDDEVLLTAWELCDQVEDLRDKLKIMRDSEYLMRVLLQELVDSTLPCDGDGVWCDSHKTKMCEVDDIISRSRAALRRPQPKA